MNRYVTVLCVAVSLLFSPMAWAGAESGPYLGVSIGTADQDYSENTDLEGLDDDASSGKVFAGYNFGLIPLLDIAVEASYVDFGEISSAIGGTSNAQLSGIDAFGLVGLKFGTIGVFAKTGIINWESEVTTAGFGATDSGSDPVVGIGVRLQLGSLAARVEYEEFDIERADIALYSVGLSWTF